MVSHEQLLVNFLAQKPVICDVTPLKAVFDLFDQEQLALFFVLSFQLIGFCRRQLEKFCWFPIYWLHCSCQEIRWVLQACIMLEFSPWLSAV